MVELILSGPHDNPSVSVAQTSSLTVSISKKWWVAPYASAIGAITKVIYPFIGCDATVRFLKSQTNFMVNRGFEFSV